MSDKDLGVHDYPLAEQRPDLIKSHGGRRLEDLTLEAVAGGDVTLEDLRITPSALNMQAEIARDAGRAALADNFERAAEMTALPQKVIMEIYELLRPGRASGKDELLGAAEMLRSTYGAERMAAFVAEAAEVYEQRGLFKFRF
jgi:propanediol dehydratase small subunit